MRKTAYIHIPLLLLCAILCSCSAHPKKPLKSVGVDPSWFPLQLEGRETNITAFSTELLKEIGRVEHIQFKKVTVSWDQLINGLLEHQYEAVLSSIPPYLFHQKIYDFSECYLPTGPVLVVPQNSTISSLHLLSGKEIASLPGTSGELILEKYPGILIRPYDSISKALSAVVDGTLDGAVVDVLQAAAYTQDLYQGQLKIATPPLNAEGLRLITLQKEDPELIRSFNAGLKELQKQGHYDQLLIKWGLKGS